MDIKELRCNTQALLAAQKPEIIKLQLSGDNLPPAETCITNTHALLDVLDEYFLKEDRTAYLPIDTVKRLHNEMQAGFENLQYFSEAPDEEQRRKHAAEALIRFDDLFVFAIQRGLLSPGLETQEPPSRPEKTPPRARLAPFDADSIRPDIDRLHKFNVLATVSSVIVASVIVLYAWLDPAGSLSHLTKDTRGGGAVENLTVIVLLPGIAAGAWAFWFRKKFPHRRICLWVLAWTMACVYFAGEEISWGQGYFHWTTPEFINSINDQGETNFHNMSSWFDQKPRMLVELFIVVAVFAGPLLRAVGYGPRLGKGRLSAYAVRWILAPGGLVVAGLLYVTVKVCGLLPGQISHTLGSSELREFTIAWFLSLYLISYMARCMSAPAEAD